ncbi:Hypothetical_protein [Hexamita inflata]|uniref:Hypothetical_protein n=1 Tax=Hexamita inflata TaxID=28002 RepID=A0AA86TU89_9EUKA|nr:Hypothetical protein HINF_LOCUS16395 [Hexamita inflata]
MNSVKTMEGTDPDIFAPQFNKTAKSTMNIKTVTATNPNQPRQGLLSKTQQSAQSISQTSISELQNVISQQKIKVSKNQMPALMRALRSRLSEIGSFAKNRSEFQAQAAAEFQKMLLDPMFNGKCCSMLVPEIDQLGNLSIEQIAPVNGFASIIRPNIQQSLSEDQQAHFKNAIRTLFREAGSQHAFTYSDKRLCECIEKLSVSDKDEFFEQVSDLCPGLTGKQCLEFYKRRFSRALFDEKLTDADKIQISRYVQSVAQFQPSVSIVVQNIVEGFAGRKLFEEDIRKQVSDELDEYAKKMKQTQ